VRRATPTTVPRASGYRPLRLKPDLNHKRKGSAKAGPFYWAALKAETAYRAVSGGALSFTIARQARDRKQRQTKGPEVTRHGVYHCDSGTCAWPLAGFLAHHSLNGFPCLVIQLPGTQRSQNLPVSTRTNTTIRTTPRMPAGNGPKLRYRAKREAHR
jgi:hypothetical protein